jgi:rod shape determining protein RodA
VAHASDDKTRGDGVLLVPTGEIKNPRTINTTALILIYVVLAVFGLANLYSATSGGHQFYAQLKHLGIGTVLFVLFGWIISPRQINTYAYWLFGVVSLMLAVVLVSGDIAGGSQRWLQIGPLRGQPSELAKISVAILVARFFYTNRLAHAYQLRDLWPLAAMVGLIFGLIFPQPDLGTAGVCLLIAVGQLAFIRIDTRSFMIVATASIIVMILGWNVLLHDYQKLRVLNLINPQLDPSGSGYNSLQSLVAVGSGKLAGKGFMQGTQTQLQFLPERHTDFIFSVFAEEHGFWGAALVFALFAAFCYISLVIARQAKDTFGGLLAIGLGVFMFIEFAINTAMVLGMFPVVGIPLPLFSYGGSAYLSICMAFGMLVAIDRDNLGRFRKQRSFGRSNRETSIRSAQKS